MTPALAAGDPAALFLAAAIRPTIVVDIDNVLAWTGEAVLTALNTHFGLAMVVDDMTLYPVDPLLDDDHAAWLRTQLDRGAFYATIAPDRDAINAVAAIGLYHDVLICTERPPATTRAATEAWLAYWRVPHDELLMPGQYGKPGVLAGFGPDDPAVLIDDDPTKAITVARPGVEVWSPRRPWTLTDWQQFPHYWVFDTWTDVLDRLAT